MPELVFIAGSGFSFKSNHDMILYKYRSLSQFEYIADILVNECLYCSKYSELNDPFEGQFIVEHEIREENPNPEGPYDSPWKTIGQEDKASDEEFLECFFPDGHIPRICSLSESVDDVRMWAHYGDSHRGIAIELDLDAPSETIHKIDYVPTLKRIPALVRDLPALEPGYWILATKTDQWTYEEEWRIFSNQPKYNVSGRIKSIVLGHRFPTDMIKAIKRLAPGLKLRKAEVVHQHSKIIIKDLAEKDFSMTDSSLAQLEEQAMQLPKDQRAALAAHLLNSLPAVLHDEDSGLAEAMRRDAELESDPSMGITLEEIRASFAK